MSTAKNTILELEDGVLGTLADTRLGPQASITRVQKAVASAVKHAKSSGDGLTQLYGCMVDAHVSHGSDTRQGLIDTVQAITTSPTAIVLAEEQGVSPPPYALRVDADTYGFYYALNDHCAKVWDAKNYQLAKHGERGNPLATHLIESFYKNGAGQALYAELGWPAAAYDTHAQPGVKHRLLHAFDKHDTRVFADVTMAFVGYYGFSYSDIVLTLDDQFGTTGNVHFSPDMLGSAGTAITPGRAKRHTQAAGHVDYAVTSNVINAFHHHGVTDDDRPKIWASCAELTRKDGLTIHVIEKPSYSSHLGINFSQPLHQALGQSLQYSFFRKPGVLDQENDTDLAGLEASDVPSQAKIDTLRGDLAAMLKTNDQALLDFVLTAYVHDNIGDLTDEHAQKIAAAKGCTFAGNDPEYATSLLVMRQTEKVQITAATLDRVYAETDGYQSGTRYRTPQYAG